MLGLKLPHGRDHECYVVATISCFGRDHTACTEIQWLLKMFVVMTISCCGRNHTTSAKS